MSRRVWNPDIDVLKVRPMDDYCLEIEFSDGITVVYDASYLVGKGVFKRFEDKGFFNRAHVGYGTVVWDDVLDIAPEALYEDSKLVVR